jgi:hypothetical protein
MLAWYDICGTTSSYHSRRSRVSRRARRSASPCSSLACCTGSSPLRPLPSRAPGKSERSGRCRRTSRISRTTKGRRTGKGKTPRERQPLRTTTPSGVTSPSPAPQRQDPTKSVPHSSIRFRKLAIRGIRFPPPEGQATSYPNRLVQEYPWLKVLALFRVFAEDRPFGSCA